MKNHLLPRHFHRVLYQGDFTGFNGRPVIAIANHSSWWDGLLIYQITEELTKSDHYIMMEESQLAQYRFFRKLGAFSVDKTSVRGIKASLDYSAELLMQNKTVWIFPQGEIRHQEHRPLRFSSGFTYLLKKVPEAVVVPLTFQYSFNQFQKPTVSLIAQPALTADPSSGRHQLAADLEAEFTRKLDGHKKLVVDDPDFTNTDFHTLYGPGKSTSDRFDNFFRRRSK